MSFLQKITPTNLLAEKEKFFADTSYNPQFVYDETVSEEKYEQHGEPDKNLVEAAQAIIAKAYHGRTETELRELDGPIISEQEVSRKLKVFIEAHGLSDTLDFVWSASFLSRATMAKYTLKLKSGVEFRDLDTIGMIYHELGTHALRRLNYEQQPWYKKKKKYGFANYLATEEGLATIHALLPRSMQLAYSVATRYLAVDYAQSHSFAELWKFLEQYIDNPETRWTVCVRQKRGVTDTSQPGGFTKDQVYFKGFVESVTWLKDNNYDLAPLYYGKMAIADIAKAREMNPQFEPILPYFFDKKREQYVARVEQIYAENLAGLV